MGNRRGFTLIELLVSISIIGILAGIAVFNYQGHVKSARDGKRMTDLEQIRSALEMYRADCGTYPPGNSPNGTLFSGNSVVGDAVKCGNTLTYIVIAADPLTGRRYRYQSLSSGNSYSLCASLERTAGNVPGTCVAIGDCGGTELKCNYEVSSP